MSDQDRSISGAFGIGGRRQPRITFIIGKGGTIADVSKHEFLIPKHISEALEVVKKLN